MQESKLSLGLLITCSPLFLQALKRIHYKDREDCYHEEVKILMYKLKDITDALCNQGLFQRVIIAPKVVPALVVIDKALLLEVLITPTHTCYSEHSEYLIKLGEDGHEVIFQDITDRGPEIKVDWWFPDATP